MYQQIRKWQHDLQFEWLGKYPLLHFSGDHSQCIPSSVCRKSGPNWLLQAICKRQLFDCAKFTSPTCISLHLACVRRCPLFAFVQLHRALQYFQSATTTVDTLTIFFSFAASSYTDYYEARVAPGNTDDTKRIDFVPFVSTDSTLQAVQANVSVSTSTGIMLPSVSYGILVRACNSQGCTAGPNTKMTAAGLFGVTSQFPLGSFFDSPSFPPLLFFENVTCLVD